MVQHDYSYGSSVTDMKSDLGWELLQSRCKNADTVPQSGIYTVVKLNADDYLTKGYSKIRSSNGNKFRQIQAISPAYSNSCSIRTIPEWNKLSETVITSAETTEAFSDCLCSHNHD